MTITQLLMTAVPLILFSTFVSAGINEQICMSGFQNRTPDFILDTALGSRHASTIHGINGPQTAGGSRGFDTELDAVLAASNIYNPLSIDEDREYIGAVLELDGSYFYTVGVGKKGENAIVVRARVPKSYSLVAFWHTHGAPAIERRYFSDADMHLVRSYGKPFYLADYTGRLCPTAWRSGFLYRACGQSGFAQERGIFEGESGTGTGRGGIDGLYCPGCMTSGINGGPI